MVDAVNTSQSFLEQIGNEGDDPDIVDSVVTVYQINAITPVVTDANPEYEELYQDYIDTNPDLFSNPATVEEVQAMVDTVNTLQGVLEQIGSEGDDPDLVNSIVTVDQINTISPGITDANPDYEEVYQDYIDANPDLFSSPATAEEIQEMVDSVNALQIVLEQIGSEGDDPDSVNSVVTVYQINTISPGITDVNPDYEEVYQDYIDANPDLFSNPATAEEIQAMVDVVNASQSVLEQIGNEGDDPDSVNSVVTVDQINTISPGITDVNPDYEEIYQDYIDNYPDLFSSPATVEEVQAMVDILNYDNDGDGVADAHDLDDDNDGILDSVEENGDEERDTDGDGILDKFDLDSDGDGISDLIEGGNDLSLDINNNGMLDSILDSDGDGLMDSVDPDSGGNLGRIPDTDDDDIPDFRDLDSDNDGVNDVEEVGGTDTDNDGKIDTQELRGLIDSDADGLPNYLDVDDDNDGVLSIDEVSGDSDGDGIPDHIDDTDSNLIPEGFSPNEDGVNDEFVIPLLSQYPNFSIEIYSRYGRKVYKYENKNSTSPSWWNGYANVSLIFNGDKMVPVGSYYYVISLNDRTGREYTGWVYVNR